MNATQKHINLVLPADEMREISISFALAARNDETKKQFYARALVRGAAELKTETTKKGLKK